MCTTDLSSGPTLLQSAVARVKAAPDRSHGQWIPVRGRAGPAVRRRPARTFPRHRRECKDEDVSPLGGGELQVCFPYRVRSFLDLEIRYIFLGCVTGASPLDATELVVRRAGAAECLQSQNVINNCKFAQQECRAHRVSFISRSCSQIRRAVQFRPRRA